jgi:glycerol uptake facilitator-like aquaporin
LDAVRSKSPWLRLLAECVAELFGTAILVVFGCSGIAQYTLSRGVLSSFLSVNFAFGFGAMIAVYVAGPISGKYSLSFPLSLYLICSKVVILIQLSQLQC